MTTSLLNHSKFKYQFIAQNIISYYPYSLIILYDTEKQVNVSISPWDIICDPTIISDIEPKCISMICVSAVNDRVKFELLLRSNLQGFAATNKQNDIS